MAAVERLAQGWNAFQRHEGIRCPMNVVVQRGVLYAFRSFLLTPDLNLTMNLQSTTSRLASGDTSIFVTGQVRKQLVGTPWDGRLQPVDIRSTSPRLAQIEFYRFGKPDSNSN